jgi:hypothetical protein
MNVQNQINKIGDLNLLLDSIVIKPGPGIDPAEKPGLGFYGSTQINPETHSFFFFFLKLLTTASTQK